MTTTLRKLFEHKPPNEYIYIRRGENTAFRFFQSVDDATEYCNKYKAHTDIYFGVCSYRTKEMSSKGVCAAYALWGDLDGESPKKPENESKEEKLHKCKTAFLLPPSITIDSGYGYHVYWMIERTCELKEVSRTTQKLQRLIGSDPVHDVTRTLRVSETFNHKYESLKPVLIEDTTAYTYTLSDIDSVLELSDKITSRIRSGSKQGFKSRSERDWFVICRLVSGGLSDNAVATIFEVHPIGDKYREKHGDKYLAHTLARAREQTNTTPEDAQQARESVFDILEKDECYWAISKTNAKMQLSTFTFEPEVLLYGTETQPDVLVGTIRASGNTWTDVTLSRKAFTRSDALLRELPKASWQWMGTDSWAKKLLPYLMERLRTKGLPRRKGVADLGYHDGLWVGSDQVITTDSGVLNKRDAPIAALPYKGERVSVNYATEEPTREEVLYFLRVVRQLNTPDIIWSIFGWLCATPYKTRLEEQGIRFPILNLYGTRGSGKTTIITNLIQRWSCYTESRTYDCTTTKFVLLSLLGSSNGVPIAFSEYRSSVVGSNRILRYLLLAYDSGHDPRGRADQSVVDYVISAPFTVDGEDAIKDSAALERMIQVNMHPETISEGSQAFSSMQDLKSVNLEVIGTKYLQYTLSKGARPFSECIEMSKKIYPAILPDRVRRNISVVIYGLLEFQGFLETYNINSLKILPELLNDVIQQPLENVVNTETGRGTIIVDEMIEELVNEIVLSGGFPPFVIKYDAESNELWFHLSTVVSWWRQARKRQNRPILETAALKAQLREREYNPVQDSLREGQYVVGREAKTLQGKTYWMYGIDVESARKSGMDIPEHLGKMFTVQPRTRQKSKD